MRRTFRPRSTKYRDVEVPLLANFVFADYDQAAELNALALTPGFDHPEFRVLHYHDAFARVPDAGLEGLRDFEAQLAAEWLEYLRQEEEAERERARRKKSRRKKTPINRRRAYVLGQRVSVTGSAFAGLTATINEDRGNGELVIVFDRSGMEWTVDSCDLSPIHIDTPKPEQARAA